MEEKYFSQNSTPPPLLIFTPTSFDMLFKITKVRVYTKEMGKIGGRGVIGEGK